MADNTNRIAGIAYLTIDGASYMMSGTWSYSVATVTRTTVKGQDRVHGYSEEPNAPHISGDIRDAGSLSVASINAMTNVTVVLELANGKTIIGRNMWTVDTQEVNTGEATFPVRFEGISVEEA